MKGQSLLLLGAGPICADWCWGCGDDFVVYENPDHIG
jgi:hypothetical protein